MQPGLPIVQRQHWGLHLCLRRLAGDLVEGDGMVHSIHNRRRALGTGWAIDDLVNRHTGLRSWLLEGGGHEAEKV